MKPRMSVARCCCDGQPPQPPVVLPLLAGSGQWEPGGTEINWIIENTLSVAAWGTWSGVGFRRVSGYIRTTTAGGAQIPQGANIQLAELIAEVCLNTASAGFSTASSGTAACDISGEDNDTATVITTAAQADALPRTLATVANYEHDLGQFNNNELRIDVTSLVQQMVDRPGWALTSQLQFLMDENGNSTSNPGTEGVYGQFMDRGGANGPADWPRVEVTYT